LYPFYNVLKNDFDDTDTADTGTTGGTTVLVILELLETTITILINFNQLKKLTKTISFKHIFQKILSCRLGPVSIRGKYQKCISPEVQSKASHKYPEITPHW
jgi:hypothetical protein